MGRYTDGTLAACTFAVVLVAHLASPVITSMDSRWSVLTAISIVREGNLDLDEFAEVRQAAKRYDIVSVGAHHYGREPLGTVLCAVPFVAAVDPWFEAVLARAPRLEAWVRARGRVPAGRPLTLEAARRPVELVVATVLVATTSAVLFLALRLRVGTVIALVCTACFAFGTSAWSTASRGLWQHGPSMLALSLALWLLLRARERPALAAPAALAVAAAALVRPANVLSLAGLGAYLVLRHRSRIGPGLLAAFAAAAAYLALNLQIYGLPLQPYYRLPRLRPWTLGEGLLANLASPSRGLFTFSPFLLFALVGIVARVRRERAGLDAWLASIVGAHLLAVGIKSIWWGGHSIGPRLTSDMLPFLTLFLSEGLRTVCGLPSVRRAVALGAFALGAIFSILVHGGAANHPGATWWNVVPVDVDAHPRRVWHWGDPQSLAPLTRDAPPPRERRPARR